MKRYDVIYFPESVTGTMEIESETGKYCRYDELPISQKAQESYKRVALPMSLDLSKELREDEREFMLTLTNGEFDSLDTYLIAELRKVFKHE